MGFNLLSFQALIIKLTGVRVIYFLVFRKISFPQSSMQRSGDGKRNLIHFHCLFIAQEMALIFRLALPKAAQ